MTGDGAGGGTARPSAWTAERVIEGKARPGTWLKGQRAGLSHKLLLRDRAKAVVAGAGDGDRSRENRTIVMV
ncbi:hypothetical protein E2C01_101036 [Portunus trituberculatus]|uniref:Uncharacterized protein n=1 Tax=Portunus trituberculatus TaxID=210409 RepID=A0A5B7K8I4_PORTR|nr:hypothetical protein [Portunus trituberculatus]